MRASLALAFALLLPLTGAAQTYGNDEDRGARDRSVEAPAVPPQYPKPENFLPFQVDTNKPFDFFVDAKSISVGADGVVRYTLIARSTEGALSVSYEGMRCADGKIRIYAFGSTGNSWFQVRNAKWEPIRSDPRNAQRAVLYSDFFCPVRGNIQTADDGVRALKNGGNPTAVTGGY